jgi:hypothetical protein
MMVSLVLGCVWVLAATGTVLLPVRLREVPGLGLLLAAAGWLAMDHGAGLGLLAAAAVLSIFCRPLAALLLRARVA